MEHSAAWGGPFEHQMATKWPAEEPPADDAQGWAPAMGLPWQYASIVDIFGSCSIQPYAPASSSSGGQQLVDYNYYANAAAAQHNDPILGRATIQDLSVEGDYYNQELTMKFQEAADKFEDDAEMKKKKMHRYHPIMSQIDRRWTVPRVVAIGPYHHCDGDRLKAAEKVKHVAAHHCVDRSGLSVREIYHKVNLVAAECRALGLYDKDVMEGMDHDDEFLPMMFYDACFLVMYMVKRSCIMEVDAALYDFLESNDNDIAHDIMLLENQIPWPLVDAVMNMYTSEPVLKEFVAEWINGRLQARLDNSEYTFEWVPTYKAPHLLGLLRFYIVGETTTTRSKANKKARLDSENLKSIDISVSAIELAEMGIQLAANKNKNLLDMGLSKKWLVLTKLSVAPVYLNDLRAGLLVNMAALELCTAPDFFDEEDAPKPEDSAVCSYLLLLCMLMNKEGDVDELRQKGILQGGAGLTNQKVLEFFTSLQSLPHGRSYAQVMEDIGKYRDNCWCITPIGFLYRNWKYIAWVGSGIGALIGITTAVLKLMGTH